MKETTRDIILGVIFFGTIAILAYFTIYLTAFSFGDKPRFQVRFPTAGGLKKGDPVLVLGTRSGRVLDVLFDDQTSDDRRVVVSLQLDHALTLKIDYVIKIEENSFLGGRVATINPGQATSPALGPGTVLTGIVEEGPLAELGKVVQANKEDFNKIIGGIRKIVDRVEKGEGTVGKLLSSDESLYNSFKETVDNLKVSSQNIREGKGALGRLINDETLANNLSSTVNNLGDLTRGMKDGKGTLGKLITDESLYNNANETFQNVRQGKGTLARLINDEEMGNNVSTGIKNFREISDKINQGDGSLAKLLNDKVLYDDFSATMKDIRVIVADAKDGKGTLGKLLRDDTLWNDIQTTFRHLNRTLEDAREAAPIGTFSALVFGAF